MCMGNSTQLWLTKMTALPSQWGLSNSRQTFLLSSGIKLLAFNSPGCTFEVQQTENELVDAKAIALFDTYVVEEARLSSDEIIAMLLHEAGHTVHKPPANFYDQTIIHLGSNADQELFADDFVRNWGRGKDLENCISKLASLDKRFNSPMTTERLRRIRNSESYLSMPPK